MFPKWLLPRKIQVRLNQEGGIYGNSCRHSQLLPDYFSVVYRAEMELKASSNDLDLLALLRPLLEKG